MQAHGDTVGFTNTRTFLSFTDGRVLLKCLQMKLHTSLVLLCIATTLCEGKGFRVIVVSFPAHHFR